MTSQEWSPDHLVYPPQWSHQVDLYVPDHPLRQKALLVINNGTNHVTGTQQPFPPNDFTQQNLIDIANSTGTIIVSVSNIPNQFLTLGTNQPSREDVSAAQSWGLFMEAPEKRTTLPMQVPMVAAVSRAMDLAQNELKPWAVDKFILSGASKRGWTAWLGSLADDRVIAIAPLVADLLDTRTTFKHIHRSYGGHWPIAFSPYAAQGITKEIDTVPFSNLMRILDPLEYTAPRYKRRLAIPKYLINASGDDFFVPDNAGHYYNRLPGQTAFRIAPNSDHAGIRNFSTSALIQLLNRLQKNSPLPHIDAHLVSGGNEKVLKVLFSETPKELKLWSAVNPTARDFRFACGIRYESETLDAPLQSNKLSVRLAADTSGWRASFVEATFNDGFIATTPVFITPEERFPQQAPTSSGAACQTLPDQPLQ